MSEAEGGPTVLILDRDLGFLFWLGGIFSEAGCQVVPALDCAQAVSTVRELDLTFDLVVLNPAFEQVQQALNVLSAQGAKPKIVVISDEKVDAIGPNPVDASLNRPRGSQDISHQEWLQRVQHVLRNVLGWGIE